MIYLYLYDIIIRERKWNDRIFMEDKIMIAWWRLRRKDRHCWFLFASSFRARPRLVACQVPSRVATSALFKPRHLFIPSPRRVVLVGSDRVLIFYYSKVYRHIRKLELLKIPIFVVLKNMQLMVIFDF